jgi:predicted HD phosphohydrolase
MDRVDQFLQLLENLRGVYDDGPEGRDAVDQLEHSLQMGTRAKEAGMDDRFVALAVLHDAFRVIAPFNHGPALAEALNDVIEDDGYIILSVHSVWQHDIVHGTNQAERLYEGQPWYELGRKFGELDAASFDPEYHSKGLRYFEPLIRKLFDA